MADPPVKEEVVEQVVARTDSVPLFVEELTKMVLESGLLQEREEGYELTGPLPPLAIPTTLHDSLMARLDRLATVKGLAQLGATLGTGVVRAGRRDNQALSNPMELMQVLSEHWSVTDLVGAGGTALQSGAT